MQLWVTRPADDGADLAQALEARGHNVIVEPLLKIEPCSDASPHLDGASAIVATSKNALRVLAKTPAFTSAVDQRLVVVGPGTADEAQRLGFHHVQVGPGRAADLPELIHSLPGIGDAPVAVLRGEDVAYDLEGVLRSLGLDVRRHILYRAVPTASPSPALVRQIADGKVDGVLLFSQRTAEQYVCRLTEARIESAARRLRHYCLSAAVAAPLRQSGFADALVSAKPNVKEMVELIG
ncbi:MAG: uroporphyrinogen-III synthase [Pseudomonadota bacterium]